eukprot:TRINITY_DN17731_c0_g1_i1.p1 TRINITY_DN17731_c0_g1~~TRINITY_DN17731_c0_g1_i1.p1  ORF type:complete len:152 (+),score=17.82 TRINITY_DN17731_c0_g1_i1:268-723(+)
METDLKEQAAAEVVIQELTDDSLITQYLETARQISPQLEDNARDLLKAFFLAARHKHRYRLETLRSIARLARCHARLQLRHHVSVSDILVGIMLNEESQCVRYGSKNSALQFEPMTEFNLDRFFVDQGDSAELKFCCFYERVLRFIATIFA